MRTQARTKLSHIAKPWPALAPKPFPLICRHASCLLVMRTGREAGPSSLAAPRRRAARANLNCVSNDASSAPMKKTSGQKNSGARLCLFHSLTVFSPLQRATSTYQCISHKENMSSFFFLFLPPRCRRLKPPPGLNLEQQSEENCIRLKHIRCLHKDATEWGSIRVMNILPL